MIPTPACQHRPMSETLISLNLSNAFLNKFNRTGRRAAFSGSFMPDQITLAQFVAHIQQGRAWTISQFRGHTRSKATFISSELLGVDCDDHVSVQEALLDPFVQQYAFLLYPSPSSTPEHPRTRIVFRLSEAVTTAARLEVILRGLIAHLAHLRPDPACIDAARMYYGSTHPGTAVNYQAVLPLDIAGALTQPEGQAEMETVMAVRHAPANRQRTGKGRKVSTKWVKAVEQALGVHHAITGESGFVIAPIQCPMVNHQHDHLTPAAYWHPEKHFLYCHKCGRSYILREVAAALSIKKPGHQDIHCELKYISDYDLAGLLQRTDTLLIKSYTGSGKTEGIIQLILAQPNSRILIIVHRRSLAKNLVKRLNEKLEKQGRAERFANYEEYSPQQLQQATHLVSCINSLHKLVAQHTLPVYDLIVLDEIEQQLAHLIGDTFDGNKAVNAYQLFHTLIEQARQVVGMDAYATSLSMNWLRNRRGDNQVVRLVNDYHCRKGTLYLHGSFIEVIHQINQTLASDDRPVIITVTSKKLAKLLYSYYSGRMDVSPEELEHICMEDGSSVAELLSEGFFQGQGLGEEAVFVVHGDNSDTNIVKDFIANINQRVPRLRVLIYNSAMGTGVDGQADVAGVFGLLRGDTLPPDELLQMLARFRKATTFHVCIQRHSTYREEDARHLLQQELQSVEDTTKLASKYFPATWEFDNQGRLRLIPSQLRFLQFWARVRAKLNRSLNHLQRDFLRLAALEYDIIRCEAAADDLALIEAEIGRLRLAQQEITRHMVLNAAPVSQKCFDNLRHNGNYTAHQLAGYLRWLIECGYRQPITPAIYDHYEQGGLRKLQAFLNTQRQMNEVLAKDMQQDAEGVAIPFRPHHVQRRQLILAALHCVWGSFSTFDQTGAVSLKHIGTALKKFLAQHRDTLATVFHWRKGLDGKPKNVLNRLLNEIGLKLVKHRAGHYKGQYSIDRACLSQMQAYAQRYLEVEAPEPGRAEHPDVIAA